MLLCQHDYLLPPQQAKWLLYSRFVNTRGIQGRNIPADLHNEQLNKACKNATVAQTTRKQESLVKLAMIWFLTVLSVQLVNMSTSL